MFPILGLAASMATAQVVPFTVTDDKIMEPLAGLVGNPTRGRMIVVNRQVGMCLLCHTGPFPEEQMPGNTATDLAGAGARWSPGQMRLRIVDSRRLDRRAFMPSFHRVEGLERVAPAWSGRPILNAQQVEDVVAFLGTLRP